MQDVMRFSNLPEYAFPRLRSLLSGIEVAGDTISMHIGEPTHAFPKFINEIIIKNSNGFNSYPPNDGTESLRQAISSWISDRYKIPHPNHENQILVLNGTREGLFNASVALSPETKNGKKSAILLPNPFYQCYMVAAMAAGAEPIFLPTSEQTNFLPDLNQIPAEILGRTTLFYLCSPSNPQGAIASSEYLITLFNMAEKYNFKILADECYSEIYYNEKPIGILEISHKISANPERAIAFNSLSKRSNLPGLRSGFVAGGPKTISELKKLKSYSGAPLPLPIQYASEAVWKDERHVKKNRQLYSKKLELAVSLLKKVPEFIPPKAGFFLWLPVKNGEIAAKSIWKNYGVKVLPGSYLSNLNHNIFGGGNPGENFIRVALVNDYKKTNKGLNAIKSYILTQ